MNKLPQYLRQRVMALQGIRDYCRVKPSHRVLINGVIACPNRPITGDHLTHKGCQHYSETPSPNT